MGHWQANLAFLRRFHPRPFEHCLSCSTEMLTTCYWHCSQGDLRGVPGSRAPADRPSWRNCCREPRLSAHRPAMSIASCSLHANTTRAPGVVHLWGAGRASGLRSARQQPSPSGRPTFAVKVRGLSRAGAVTAGSRCLPPSPCRRHPLAAPAPASVFVCDRLPVSGLAGLPGCPQQPLAAAAGKSNEPAATAGTGAVQQPRQQQQQRRRRRPGSSWRARLAPAAAGAAAAGHAAGAGVPRPVCRPVPAPAGRPKHGAAAGAPRTGDHCPQPHGPCSGAGESRAGLHAH